MNKCKYCEKEINNKGSLARHQKECKLNPNRVERPSRKGCIPWNKGLTKETDSRCGLSKQTIENISKALTNNPNNTGKAKTPEAEAERIRKITEKAKVSNGGYRPGSGRGKKGWYKGIFCDSSWELAFVIYHLDHNKDIQRCKEVRTYVFENETKNYYPDFIVDDVIYEIKGYVTDQSKAKELYNPDIQVITKEKFKKYLDYTVTNYGKDFINLYNS